MNDNDHTIALHILETLMNFNGPLSLEELSSTLKSSASVNSPCLPPYLVSLDQTENLRCFLKNYPSLFCMQDNLIIPITCADFGYTESFLNNNNNNACNYGPVSVSVQYMEPYQINPETIDFATEQLAVRYFKFQLARRKGEQWVSIRSLSGHLSQAKQNIKNLLPSLTDFINLLKRHPDVFIISDEHVSLVEKMNTNQISSLTPTLPVKGTFLPPLHHQSKGRHLKPRFKYRRKVSPSDDTRSLCSNQSYINGSEFKETIENSSRIDVKFPDLPKDQNGQEVKVTLPVIEYCAVMLIRRLLFRVGSQGTHPGLILRRLFRAPSIIREVIGWTRIELDEFISKHSVFFERIPLTLPITSEVIDSSDKHVEGDYLIKVPDETIRLKVDIFLMEEDNSPTYEKVNVSNLSKKFDITNGVSKNDSLCNSNNASMGLINMHYRSTEPNSQFTSTEEINQSCLNNNHSNEEIISKNGIIFHVAKLWGIIDLGQHEHVFFDKSIFKNVQDLQKHFQLGEAVYFNAIQAPRRSRAKWKATRVWKEDDHVTLRSIVRLNNGYKQTTANNSDDSVVALKRCNSLAGDTTTTLHITTNNNSILKSASSRQSFNGGYINGNPSLLKSDHHHEQQYIFQQNNEDSEEDEEEENSRFLGDQDLGLSLLSLADLENIDKQNGIQQYPQNEVFININEDDPLLPVANNTIIKKDNAEIGEEAKKIKKKSSINNEDETLDQITNIPQESCNNSQATTITTNNTTSASSSSSSAAASAKSKEENSVTSSKSIACQTIITGRLNPKYLYKGDLCSLDESYDDPSISESLINPVGTLATTTTQLPLLVDRNSHAKS